MNTVAIIPAKGASTRIPGKNLRPFHGRPIIAYSIETAQRSGLFDQIYVSTDSDAVADVALACGAYVSWRQRRLTEDDIGTQEVTAAALRQLYGSQPRIDIACCIYATAPLLEVADLQQCYEALRELGPRYAYIEGWCYFGAAVSFIEQPAIAAAKAVRIEVPGRWIDINTLDDWRCAERMYAEQHRIAA